MAIRIDQDGTPAPGRVGRWRKKNRSGRRGKPGRDLVDVVHGKANACRTGDGVFRRGDVEFKDHAVGFTREVSRAGAVGVMDERQAERAIEGGRPFEVGNAEDDEIEAGSLRLMTP